jgi:hypothetical protein
MSALAIIARIREHGGDIRLLEDRHRIALEHRSRIPDDLAHEARENADELRMLLKAQSSTFSAKSALSASLDSFGPRSRGGRLCRRCLTICLVRPTPQGEQCDDCILADARATVTAVTAQGMISGAA